MPFEDFYEANVHAMIGALTATLGDPALALAATRESMIRASVNWTTATGTGNAFGWTFRVAFEWATGRGRRKRLNPAGFWTDLCDIEDQAVDHVAVIDALLLLPVQCRAVVVLRRWMDWSVAETAEALRVPQGTVRRRMARARRCLPVLLDVESGVGAALDALARTAPRHIGCVDAWVTDRDVRQRQRWRLGFIGLNSSAAPR